MTERELQQLIREACAVFRLLCYHTHDSRRSEPGFPDLVVVGSRCLFRELKTTRGRLTTAQTTWLTALAAASVDAAVWRPADWPEPILTQLRSIR